MNDTHNFNNTLIESDNFDFEELEKSLQENLDSQFSDLEILEEDRRKINNPDELGATVMNVVWEEFINQVGVVAGEDFIKENRGLKLDLSKDSHIQTTENFSNGKIASHNTEIDYQERHDNYMASFERDTNGNIKTHQTRTGRQEANLSRGARHPFDKGRPTGSLERGTDMDHTVSAGEILRDPELNTHLSREQQIDFANSDDNLNEMNSSWNRSKSDLKMDEWINNPNRKGQKPSEIFDMSQKDEKALIDKDLEARMERDKRAAEGKKISIDTGKHSRKQEAFRIGGKALRAFVMGLLASLVKDIIKKFIAWMRSSAKSFKTFYGQIKDSIKGFVQNLKQNLINATDTFLTTISTALFGPIIGLLKKTWILLKQGAKSIKDALNYLKNPENKSKSFDIRMLEVSKILVVGLTAAGAIVLSEVVEKTLLSIPVFHFQIPFFGSLGSILGMFLGALASGLVGALALRTINKIIEKKQIRENTDLQVNKNNSILNTQGLMNEVAENKFKFTRFNAINSIGHRHKESANVMRESIENIMNEPPTTNEHMDDNTDAFNNLFNDIDNL